MAHTQRTTTTRSQRSNVREYAERAEGFYYRNGTMQKWLRTYKNDCLLKEYPWVTIKPKCAGFVNLDIYFTGINVIAASQPLQNKNRRKIDGRF